MARRFGSFDESDVRVRPGKGSRPRTKDRPKHEDAIVGRVTAVDRGRWTTLLLEGSEGSAPLASRARPHGTVVVAMRARELGRKGIVVGDVVGLVGDVSGAPDTLARIVRVHDRSTMLRRTADDTDPVERPIVANADQLVVVSALADPAPSPGLIDRCLVAAYDAGMDPLLVLTKADLTDPELDGRWLDFVAERATDADGEIQTSVRTDVAAFSTAATAAGSGANSEARMRSARAKPPTARVAPSGMSATASADEETTLSMTATVDGRRRCTGVPPPHASPGRRG